MKAPIARSGTVQAVALLKNTEIDIVSPKLLGYIDLFSESLITGWAWNSEKPDEWVELELWVDGEKHGGSFPADLFRADLRKNGIGSGCHGFSLNIPAPFLDGKKHLFDIRYTNTGASIRNSPCSITTKPNEETSIVSSIFLDQVLLKDACVNKNLKQDILRYKKVVILCSYTPDGMRYGYHDYLQQALGSEGYLTLGSIWIPRSFSQEWKVTTKVEPCRAF